jgi:formylmethanofuran dehydrogenase subunit E
MSRLLKAHTGYIDWSDGNLILCAVKDAQDQRLRHRPYAHCLRRHRGARAETPEEWVGLGTRVHGAFGSFIPVGIRIGLDALRRLNAEPSGVTVVYYSGRKAPCPCPADGIALATMASPGQGTLQVSSELAADGLMGVAVIRSEATGVALKYMISESWILRLIDLNKILDPMARYEAVMKEPNLFSVETVPATEAPPK